MPRPGPWIPAEAGMTVDAGVLSFLLFRIGDVGNGCQGKARVRSCVSLVGVFDKSVGPPPEPLDSRPRFHEGRLCAGMTMLLLWCLSAAYRLGWYSF